MAKKLNKKVAIIGAVLLILVLVGGMALIIGPARIARKLGIKGNPDKALARARQLLEAGDYVNAEKEFGLAFYNGKTDEYKIERLYDIADFHLINNSEHEAEWNKALGAWDKITKIDSKNIDARRKILDYFFQAAEAGNPQLWTRVKEITEEILELMEEQGATPEAELLVTHAKSLLFISVRGETTNRKELLVKCLDVLDNLIDQTPDNEELYLLKAQAAIQEGELNQLAGIRNATQKAQDSAIQVLTTGIEQAEDKAAAIANLLLFKLQSTPSDPNVIERFRTEIENYTKEIEPNDKLLLVTSIAYENPGKMAPQAELNRAIETARQAHELKPEKIEYIFRIAQLLYRKGSAFNDPDAISDAIEVAENALTEPGTQDTPGPLKAKNLTYRFHINGFLSEIYLEKAFQANKIEDNTAADKWMQKAQVLIDEIVSFIGTTENPTVEKFHGMLALAKGQEDKAIRLMYKAYEQSKALDQAGSPSQIDPVLCVTLAEIMKDKNELGLRIEFLSKAINNHTRFISQKPTLLLDFAEAIRRSRSMRNLQMALALIYTYQNRSGTDLRSQNLQAEILLLAGEYEKAQQVISQMPDTDPAKIQLNIHVLNGQINQIKSITQSQKEKSEELSAEQIQELKQLRAERIQQLHGLLSHKPEPLNGKLLATAYYDMIHAGQMQEVATLIDQYLSEYPDNLSLKVLKLQMKEDEPLQITRQHLLELELQALTTLPDSKEKSLRQAEIYRNQGDYDNALKSLRSVPKEDENNSPVLVQKFEIVLAQKDIQEAERLLGPLRNQNADFCEGNFFSAQVEELKGNDSLALRRLEECLMLQPLSSEVYFVKSRIYNKLEDYDLAIENLQTATRMDPLNPLYLRNLTSVLFARNAKLGSKVTPQQKEEAQQAIQNAKSLNPADWQLQSVYAESIFESDPDQALAIRQDLLKNHPTATNALMLGNMAMRIARSEWDAAKTTGLAELAGNAYRQAIELEPDNTTAQQTYADYLTTIGNTDQVTEVLKDDKNLLWKYYLRNSQFQKALEILNELYEKTPNDGLVVQGLVLALEGIGEREQVKDYLDIYCKLDDNKSSQLWALQKYLDNSYSLEAEEKLPRMKERFPDEKSLLLIEAWIAMENGRLQDSLSLTNRYLETDTENPGAWRLRGRVYRLMNQPENAIRDLQHSNQISLNPMVRLELAATYNEMGNLQAAIGQLKQGLNDPQAPFKLWLLLESLYQKNKQYNELYGFHKSSIEKYPYAPYWHYKAGELCLKLKDYAKAQNHLLQAWNLNIEQKNLDTDVLISYFESLYQADQYDDVYSFASGLIDSPIAPIAYTYMAQVQLKQNQQAEAIVSYNKALDKIGVNESMREIVLKKILSTVGSKTVENWYIDQLSKDPKSIPAHLVAYSLAQKEGRYNDAIEHLDQCIEILGPDHPGWLPLATYKSTTLVMSYIKTADNKYFAQTVELFEAILEKQPNNFSVMNNLAFLLLDADQQIEKALAYARKVHQSSPGNATYLDTYAYAQCKSGQYEEAEQNLLRAIQITQASQKPIPWDMHKHLGIARQGLGKNSQAIGSYQKAETSVGIPEKEKLQLQQTIEQLMQ